MSAQLIQGEKKSPFIEGMISDLEQNIEKLLPNNLLGTEDCPPPRVIARILIVNRIMALTLQEFGPDGVRCLEAAYRDFCDMPEVVA